MVLSDTNFLTAVLDGYLGSFQDANHLASETAVGLGFAFLDDRLHEIVGDAEQGFLGGQFRNKYISGTVVNHDAGTVFFRFSVLWAYPVS